MFRRMDGWTEKTANISLCSPGQCKEIDWTLRTNVSASYSRKAITPQDLSLFRENHKKKINNSPRQMRPCFPNPLQVKVKKPSRLSYRSEHKTNDKSKQPRDCARPMAANEPNLNVRSSAVVPPEFNSIKHELSPIVHLYRAKHLSFTGRLRSK